LLIYWIRLIKFYPPANANVAGQFHNYCKKFYEHFRVLTAKVRR